jgi:hypothetical protein
MTSPCLNFLHIRKCLDSQKPPSGWNYGLNSYRRLRRSSGEQSCNWSKTRCGGRPWSNPILLMIPLISVIFGCLWAGRS